MKWTGATSVGGVCVRNPSLQYGTNSMGEGPTAGPARLPPVQLSLIADRLVAGRFAQAPIKGQTVFRARMAY